MIAAVGAADADDVAAFLQVAYRQTYVGLHAMTAPMFDGDPFRQRTATALRERLPNDDVVLLVARDDNGRIVATIGLRPDSEDRQVGEIWGFYVDRAHQGQGHGRALWDALMADPHTSAYRQLYLHVVVGLDDAVRFYERRGFVADGVEGSWEWPSDNRPVRTRYLTMRRAPS